MDLKGKRLILGSNSPRRKELLSGLCVPFTVDTGTDFVEDMSAALRPELIPVKFSEGKSYGFHRPLEEDEILITADTVVIAEDGRVPLGKPEDRADAVRMLEMLSGKSHKVVTAVTFRDCRHCETVSDTTVVHFKTLSAGEIDFYIDNFRPFDKAGAYGVQEWIGYVGISGIDGSFYNVMGFPVHKVYGEIIKFVEWN